MMFKTELKDWEFESQWNRYTQWSPSLLFVPAKRRVKANGCNSLLETTFATFNNQNGLFPFNYYLLQHNLYSLSAFSHFKFKQYSKFLCNGRRLAFERNPTNNSNTPINSDIFYAFAVVRISQWRHHSGRGWHREFAVLCQIQYP